MIKTMNSKMTTNSQLLKIEVKKKNKISNQLEQEQNHRKGNYMEGYNLGRGRAENEGKGTGNKKYKWQVQNRQGEIQNSISNGEAKELTCTTHGHELRQEE